jgi:hypothetical protein
MSRALGFLRPPAPAEWPADGEFVSCFDPPPRELYASARHWCAAVYRWARVLASWEGEHPPDRDFDRRRRDLTVRAMSATYGWGTVERRAAGGLWVVAGHGRHYAARPGVDAHTVQRRWAREHGFDVYHLNPSRLPGGAP